MYRNRGKEEGFYRRNADPIHEGEPLSPNLIEEEMKGEKMMKGD